MKITVTDIVITGLGTATMPGILPAVGNREDLRSQWIDALDSGIPVMDITVLAPTRENPEGRAPLTVHAHEVALIGDDREVDLSQPDPAKDTSGKVVSIGARMQQGEDGWPGEPA